MKKQLVIIGIVAILVSVGLSGCESESKDDEQFKADVFVIDEKLTEIEGDIVDAVESQDTNTFKIKSNLLKYSVDGYKEMIVDDDVSSKYQSDKTEYLAYLDDLYLAGTYGEQGDFDNYLKYYKQAVQHYSQVDIS
jgi:hypothetical protein